MVLVVPNASCLRSPRPGSREPAVGRTRPRGVDDPEHGPAFEAVLEGPLPAGGGEVDLEGLDGEGAAPTGWFKGWELTSAQDVVVWRVRSATMAVPMPPDAPVTRTTPCPSSSGG